MSKVLVIPDVHLKPWIFEAAEDELSKGAYDRVVCLGDLVDDWGQEYNLNLYEETLDTVAKFMKRHPDMLFCYGNHDLSYEWEALESGYSPAARNTVLQGLSKLRKSLPPENIAIIHKVDDVLFSHAGLSQPFVSHFFPDHEGELDSLLERINGLGRSELWNDASPLWARPQDGRIEMYPGVTLQVVGHTPVKSTDYFNGVLSVDNFSTFRNGNPIGDQKFVWVDTATGQWGFSNKGMIPEELPDPKLDYRTYKLGDTVRFETIKPGSKEPEIVEGVVSTIDSFPDGSSSIDVFSADILYKHIPLSSVISVNGQEG